jgi:YfiH family protein
MLIWSERVPGPHGAVLRGLTGRSGGVSAGPYATLNLGDHVGDDPAAVRANRAVLAKQLGLRPDRVVVARQVHGAHVEHVSGPWPGQAPEADALVTTEPGLAVAVLVADCVPVMLVAPAEGIVAVAHAGRQGMAAGVVPAVLAAMTGLGATEVLATVGPSVCARCYEVPAAMRDAVAGRSPVSASVSRHGRPSIDVAAGVLDQLASAGVAVDLLPGCTLEDPGYYSYRRDGATGRFAGLAWREPDDARVDG